MLKAPKKLLRLLHLSFHNLGNSNTTAQDTCHDNFSQPPSLHPPSNPGWHPAKMASRGGMSPLKRTYLVGYNALSAALWSVVLVRTAQTLYSQGPAAVYPTIGEWTKWTQTLAGLEIVHSVLGSFVFLHLLQPLSLLDPPPPGFFLHRSPDLADLFATHLSQASSALPSSPP